MTEDVGKIRPFGETVVAAQVVIQRGIAVFQTFVCRGCGQQRTIAKPYVFYIEGVCECGAVTQIEECGFVMGFGVGVEGTNH